MVHVGKDLSGWSCPIQMYHYSLSAACCAVQKGVGWNT